MVELVQPPPAEPVHLDSRRGNPICRDRDLAARLTMNPLLTTCLRCRELPQFSTRVRWYEAAVAASKVFRQRKRAALSLQSFKG